MRPRSRAFLPHSAIRRTLARFISPGRWWRARASTSPHPILTTTIRWAGMSLVGFVACLFGVVGYVFGLSFLASPILKMLYPDRVGLWVGPNYWNLSLGALSAAERARDHATEVLGWWLVPI
jgi:hypothetical protein